MALEFEIYGRTIQPKELRYETIDLLESEDFSNLVTTSQFNSLTSDLKTNYLGLTGGKIEGNLVVTGNITLSGNFDYTENRNYISTPLVELASNRKYIVDTTVFEITATLPPSPILGDEIEFLDVYGKWNTNPLYLISNTSLIEKTSGQALKCDIKYGNFKVNYVDPLNYGWKVTLISDKFDTTTTLLSGLIAFWNLNETSGFRLDSSGNNYILKDVNTNTLGSTGKILNAVQFTGTNNKTLSSQIVLPVGNTKPFTLSFWINYITFQNPGSRIITFNPTGASTKEWGIVHSSNQFLIFNNFGQSIAALSTSDPAKILTSGIWYHIVITKDSNYNWKYYRNGILLLSDTKTSNEWFSEDNTAIYIGQNLFNYTTDGPPNGLIDAVGIWNRVLSDIEISELYNNGSGIEL